VYGKAISTWLDYHYRQRDAREVGIWRCLTGVASGTASRSALFVFKLGVPVGAAAFGS
jgi:hypothetical protein